MEPAHATNTATAEPPQRSSSKTHHKKHRTHSSKTSSHPDSSKPATEPAGASPSKPAESDGKAQGRSDAGPPAAKGSGGASSKQKAPPSSSETAPPPGSAPTGSAAKDGAPAACAQAPVPATGQRSPRSVVIPVLVVAGAILLIVSVTVGSLIWHDRFLNPAYQADKVTSGSTESVGPPAAPTTAMPLCPPIPNLSPGAAVVSTTTGMAVGSTVSVKGVNLSRWLGVPYAQSTAGERRFATPLPLSASGRCAEVHAVKPQPPCAQWFEGTGVVGNEDCLRMNIWAPAANASGDAKRSLVLAATGHWFQTGNNDVPQWEELAAQAGVVVMSPNVRLGVLGFLHPIAKGITQDVAEEDAMAALRWAHDNAAAFGADPAAVMLVGNGTGGYLLAQAAGRLKLDITRAVFEGSLYTSAVPFNMDAADPSKDLAARLGCDVNKSDTWSACFSKISLETLLSTASQMDLRFTPAMDMSVILSGGKRKLPKINDVITGADIAQARVLIEQYVKPKAIKSGNASTPAELFAFTISYVAANDSLVISMIENHAHGLDDEGKLMLLAQAVSGCSTRAAALSASHGHHYVVDGGVQPLFEPLLSTAGVAQFLSKGKVPNLKRGEAWPPVQNGSRYLFSNGTEVIDTAQICTMLQGVGR